MPLTRIFKSGNSQAVRIPAELAYADMTQDLQITRMIAAHAIALSAVLVTNNEQDFRDIPGLALENWTVAMR